MTKTVYVLVKSGPIEGHKYAVKSDSPILIGRSEEANIRIAYDEYCSRKHAKVYWDNDKCYLQDLESTNGTYVNGAKINGKLELSNNDIIALGSTELIVLISDVSDKDKKKQDDGVSYDD